MRNISLFAFAATAGLVRAAPMGDRNEVASACTCDVAPKFAGGIAAGAGAAEGSAGRMPLAGLKGQASVAAALAAASHGSGDGSDAYMDGSDFSSVSDSAGRRQLTGLKGEAAVAAALAAASHGAGEASMNGSPIGGKASSESISEATSETDSSVGEAAVNEISHNNRVLNMDDSASSAPASNVPGLPNNSTGTYRTLRSNSTGTDSVAEATAKAMTALQPHMDSASEHPSSATTDRTSSYGVVMDPGADSDADTGSVLASLKTSLSSDTDGFSSSSMTTNSSPSADDAATDMKTSGADSDSAMAALKRTLRSGPEDSSPSPSSSSITTESSSSHSAAADDKTSSASSTTPKKKLTLDADTIEALLNDPELDDVPKAKKISLGLNSVGPLNDFARVGGNIVGAGLDVVQGSIDQANRVAGDVINIVPDAVSKMLNGKFVDAATGAVRDVAKLATEVPGKVAKIPVKAVDTLLNGNGIDLS
ncbi:hypothetical protein XA68_14803 [Ophiocordyceps unilateralis]|uniref:Uncharacterized protein n=1 Tax=Ophiocordyceps unilateralis TaxID=268505 RepID=A0A2A9P9U2_OPHUN|nr:hypothetical protein XA68_14803 [Ophiocordyceps unilateralis]